jgi:hypothetical protein
VLPDMALQDRLHGVRADAELGRNQFSQSLSGNSFMRRSALRFCVA